MLFTLPHVLQYNHIWWDYDNANKHTLREAVIYNIIKMLSCGLHVRGCACYACSNTDCTHVKLVPFTCKSRFYPSCGKKATAAWIQRQIELLPKSEWQHITFTIPETISRLFKLIIIDSDVFCHDYFFCCKVFILTRQMLYTKGVQDQFWLVMKYVKCIDCRYVNHKDLLIHCLSFKRYLSHPLIFPPYPSA